MIDSRDDIIIESRDDIIIESRDDIIIESRDDNSRDDIIMSQGMIL